MLHLATEGMKAIWDVNTGVVRWQVNGKMVIAFKGNLNLDLF
jgi:hypothetical protein